MARHVLFETGIRRVGSKEKGFSFRYPDSGEFVREEKVLKRIESLKVPPAYEEVRIARGPSAKVQAVEYARRAGFSTSTTPSTASVRRGRSSSASLAAPTGLPKMRRIAIDHLRHEKLNREKVLACITRLMNAAHFHVGEERYVKKNKAYGIATIRRKHLTIEGDSMIFEYTGVWVRKHSVA